MTMRTEDIKRRGKKKVTRNEDKEKRQKGGYKQGGVKQEAPETINYVVAGRRRDEY